MNKVIKFKIARIYYFVPLLFIFNLIMWIIIPFPEQILKSINIYVSILNVIAFSLQIFMFRMKSYIEVSDDVILIRNNLYFPPKKINVRDIIKISYKNNSLIMEANKTKYKIQFYYLDKDDASFLKNHIQNSIEKNLTNASSGQQAAT